MRMFLSVIFLLCGLFSCRGSVKTLGVEFKTDIRKLSNGLTVIMIEDSTVPVITYQTYVRAGSVDERPGKTGIAHLFEHLMFKGTENYGPKEFFKKLEIRGAQVNAYTTRDYTAYYETFIPPLLDTVIELESDRLANLKIDQKLLDTERQVVFEERRLRTENSPAGKMNEALWNLAYRRHPYRHPVIGYPLDLARLSAEDLNRFFKKHYAASNVTLVIVGDFKADEAYSKIRKAYAHLPDRGTFKRKIRKESIQKSEKRLQLYDHVASDKIMIAYQISSAFDTDSYSLDVLANILFEGTSSRAHMELVESKEIFLALGGSAFTPTYPGLFMIRGTLGTGQNLPEAEDLLFNIFEEVKEKGVTQEEVSTAVKQLTVELMDSVRTPYGLGQVIGTAQMVLGDARRFADDLSKYLEVTPESVKKVAIKYFEPNRRAVVVMSPKKTKKSKTKKSKTKNIVKRSISR